ncbi:MAG: DUF1573 domain-containing protein [Bacteroidota bacterium]
MKKNIFVIYAVLVVLTCWPGLAQEQKGSDYILIFDGEELYLDDDKTELGFGSLQQNGMAAIFIQVENNSGRSLRIANVRGSCGLSVPSWPRKILEPGERGTIQVRYDSSRPGLINRHLTIHANTTSSVTVLPVTGYVRQR